MRQAETLCEQHPDSILAQLLVDCEEKGAIDKIFASARQGDPHAENIVNKSARYLGLSLVNAINFINPELILLGGMFAQEGDVYIPILREIADEYSFAGLGKDVEIRKTSFGWRAGLLGASTLALTHFFYLPPEDIR